MVTDWQAEVRRSVAVSSTKWFEDHRGVATWDDVGTPISVAYGNDGYREDKRSQVEVGVLRKFLREQGVAELGFATDRDGYSWAMLIGAAHSDLTRDVLRKAWVLASEKLGRGDQPGDVPEAIEEVWTLISRELAANGTVSPF